MESAVARCDWGVLWWDVIWGSDCRVRLGGATGGCDCRVRLEIGIGAGDCNVRL